MAHNAPARDAQAQECAGAASSDSPSSAEVGALLESMSDPVALIGTDGRMRLANTAYRQLLADAGVSEGPISGAPEVQRLRDREGKPIRDSDRALTRALKGESIRGERVLRMADGRDRVFSLNTSPVRGDGGAIQGVAVVWRDITQQITRERALRLLEGVRRGLSMSGDLRRAARSVCVRAVSLLTWVDMAAVFALDGGELRLMAQSGFPQRAARLLPSMMMQPTHQTSIALRENRATVFQTDRDEPASESSRRVIAASGAATFVNLPLASGTLRFGLLTLASRNPHSSHPDDLALLGAMAAQVGLELEAVRRREQAETERSRLQAVLDQLPEGVLLFDAGGRLVASNHSAEGILGQSVDPSTQARGLATRYGFHHPDGRPYQPVDEPVARAFSTGRTVLGEEQIVRRADGQELPVVSNVAPVRDAKGQLAAVIMVFQDITSLREMDRLKDDFLSIAGHELRTPITTIRGLAQLLERRRDRLDPATVNSALATISEQTEHMTRLVDELLDVSRIRTGRLSLKMEAVDLVDVLRSSIEQTQLQWPGRIEGKLPGPLPVGGDAGHLKQVFINLLDNAVKYSGPTATIEVTAARSHNRAIVQVVDHGVGVPPQALGRLFERFYRAENAALYAGGLGLGLYLCREIVESHGGSIEVQSTLGEGSTFTVSLPLNRGRASRG